MIVVKRLWVAGVAILAMSLVGTTVATAKAPKRAAKAPAPVVLTGVVQVDKNAKGKVTAVTLISPIGNRHVLVLDASAKKLAAAHADQDVEVVATEKKSKKGSAFKVKSYKVAPEPTPEPDEEPEPGWEPDEEDDYDD